MFKLVYNDLRHKAEWYGLSPTGSSVARMVFTDASLTQIVYRAMRFCQTHRLGPLAYLLYRWNAFVSGAVIGRGADFGPGFILLHSVGVVINTDVRAGSNLVLEHGVTIGAEKGKSPVLGSNVFVGAGAAIVGDITIGSDVKIGANAVVIGDLPDGATAVGIPARIVRIYGQRVEAGKVGGQPPTPPEAREPVKRARKHRMRGRVATATPLR